MTPGVKKMLVCTPALVLLAYGASCTPNLDGLLAGNAGGSGTSTTTASASSTGGGGTEGSATSTSSATSGAGSTASSSGTTGGTDAGTDGEAGVAAPTLRFDFETDADGWRQCDNQTPPDVQDNVAQSTTAAHHGSGSLSMTYDGNYTPLDAGQHAFNGVTVDAVGLPTSTAVTMWLMASMPGISVTIFTQLTPDYQWVVVGTASLPANTWKQVKVLTPANKPALRMGVVVNSPLDTTGTIYLDEVSW